MAALAETEKPIAVPATSTGARIAGIQRRIFRFMAK